MKIIILGLDGATWDVLNILVKKGSMPNLEFLIKNGSRGVLESTIPPVTGCSWLSLATGLNPGKTGVIDFLKFDKRFELRLVNSLDFRDKAFWDLLSTNEKKCMVLDYPMLYPAYPINGVIVSSWGGRLDTFPKKVMEDIRRLVGKYDIFVRYYEEKYDDVDLFLHDLNKALDKKIKVTKFLLKRYNWDLCVNIIPFTDWIQHRMWHYIDNTHPLYSGENDGRLSSFVDFWKRIDDLIGKSINYGDYVFIVSDHGFGPQYGCFNLVKWLKMKGYLVRKRSFKSAAKLLLPNFAKRFLATVLPERIKKKTRKFITTMADIDLKKSKVYVVGHTIPFGAIYINVKNRNPAGIVNKGHEYELLKKEIINSLLNLKDDIGKDVKVTVFDVKEIYSGDKIELLPDIIFTINDWSCMIVKDFNANFLYKDTTYSFRHTGSHRLNGIFLAYGPDVKENFEIKNLKMFDIAPTILYMFNMSIPRDMDGKVIKSIFKENSELAKRSIIFEGKEERRIKKLIKKIKQNVNT